MPSSRLMPWPGRVLRRRAAALVSFGLVASLGCAPQAHIKLMPEGDPIQPGDQVNVGFLPSETSIAIAVTNFGDEPVQILWHKSSLVGVDGEAMDIIHEGGRGLAEAIRVTGEDYSSIPPQSTLRDRIYVRRALSVDDDEVEVGTYFPVECGVFACDLGDAVAGNTIRLSLTFRRGAVEKTYDWRFRIVQAFYSLRGGRPAE